MPLRIMPGHRRYPDLIKQPLPWVRGLLLLLAGAGLAGAGLAGAGLAGAGRAGEALLDNLPRLVKVDAATRSIASLSQHNPDAACAGCHREIYDKYATTPMARASGVAMDGFLEGGFTHAPSGVTYGIHERDGAMELRYDRAPEAARAGHEDAKGALHGARELEYFIGSNHRGRTYLYREGKQWFEAPINFYSKRALWDMAPNYGDAKTMPAPLPVDANCLHCHATAIATPLPEARNAFASAPFAQGGIGCAACHGDPSQHLATQGHGPITNPRKLSAVRRDSVCLQCHLEGDATVYRTGSSLAAFQPGDDLSSNAVYFVKSSRASGGGRASSQYEALLRSACKRASGDRLTCTTCHDPHSSPAPAERVAWFRGRCLSCHNTPAIAERHHPEQQDCATCHMPTRDATDISHEQATDHNIQSRPHSATGQTGEQTLRLRSLAAAEELIPLGSPTVGDRELGLAYAQLAGAEDQAMGERAQHLLRHAEAGGANDATLHTQLGYLDQRSGDHAAAAREYAAALVSDPYETTALVNLAVLDATNRHLPEAMRLLERAVEADPSKTAAGMNLAFLECSLGKSEAASDLLARLARINPDDPTLRRFRETGMYAGQTCTLRAADQAHR